MEGKIKKIMEKVASNNKPFKSVLIGEEWFSCWSESINKTLVEGETVSFEFEQNGSFKNINKLLTGENKVEEIFIQSSKPDKDTRIGRLAVLNTSTEIHKQSKSDLNDKDLLESIKRVAADLEAWTNR